MKSRDKNVLDLRLLDFPEKTAIISPNTGNAVTGTSSG
jgi:hypothetical protein